MAPGFVVRLCDNLGRCKRTPHHAVTAGHTPPLYYAKTLAIQALRQHYSVTEFQEPNRIWKLARARDPLPWTRRNSPRTCPARSAALGHLADNPEGTLPMRCNLSQ